MYIIYTNEILLNFNSIVFILGFVSGKLTKLINSLEIYLDSRRFTYSSQSHIKITNAHDFIANLRYLDRKMLIYHNGKFSTS